MAIEKMEKEATQNIVGKFACLESPYRNTPAGKPVLITKVSGKRVYYKQLGKGVYDKDLETWIPSQTPDDYEEYCSPSKLTFVCDTVEEAIDLYLKSKKFSVNFFKMEKEMMADFERSVLEKNGMKSKL